MNRIQPPELLLPQNHASFPDPSSLLEMLTMPRAIPHGPIWQIWFYTRWSDQGQSA